MSIFNFKNNATPLPSNRFLQFFYLIKENFLLLFYTSITYFIFYIPSFYILLSTYIKYQNLLNNSGTRDELFKTLFIGGILLIPTLLISSLGNIGMHNIIKKISYNEVALYKDFFTGIKKNYLKYLSIQLLDSVFSGLIIINYATFLFIEIRSYIKLISLIISTILFLIIKLLKPFYMTQIAIFNNNKFQIFKNSFNFAVIKIFKNLGMFFLSNLLIILILLLPEKMRVIDMVIIVILGGAYNILTSHLNSLSIMEKFMDKNIYSSIFHKGLIDFYKKEEYDA